VRAPFRRFLAGLLLSCFSVFLIPEEFVHALYGHTDTQEQASDSGKNSVGTHHIHCSFLTYEASHFISSSIQNCPAVTENSFSFTSVKEEQQGISFSGFPSLRGPPQLF
jgi:hypothetical protein